MKVTLADGSLEERGIHWEIQIREVKYGCFPSFEVQAVGVSGLSRPGLRLVVPPEPYIHQSLKIARKNARRMLAVFDVGGKHVSHGCIDYDTAEIAEKRL